MKNLIRTNVFLSGAQRTALAKIARRRKVSSATVLRELVDAAFHLTGGATPFSHPVQNRAQHK